MKMLLSSKISKRFENKALHYLQRYTSSEAHLRQILWRFFERKIAPHQSEDDHQSKQSAEESIDSVIENCKRFGYLSDSNYAQAKTKNLRARGKSRVSIIAYLKKRGIENTMITTTLEDQDLGGEAAERAAAFRYARRSGVGVFAEDRERQKDGWQQRHLARMARAGFSRHIAQKIIEARDETDF